MEKSGQGVTYPEIIDEKNLVSRKRAFAETMITLGFWGIILYFIGIIITFILWYFGIEIFYYEIFAGGFQELQRLFGNAAVVTFIVICILLCWSWYNLILIKIKGERRRSRVSICFDEDLARIFHIDLETLENAKGYPRVSVDFQKDKLTFIPAALPAPPTEQPQ